MAKHRASWGSTKADREAAGGFGYGLPARGVTSCLSCGHWVEKACRKAQVPAVMRWRRGRVTDSEGVVWHFGDGDGTPDKLCPRREDR
jgi:hypothetical protein